MKTFRRLDLVNIICKEAVVLMHVLRRKGRSSRKSESRKSSVVFQNDLCSVGMLKKGLILTGVVKSSSWISLN